MHVADMLASRLNHEIEKTMNRFADEMSWAFGSRPEVKYADGWYMTFPDGISVSVGMVKQSDDDNYLPVVLRGKTS
jgi:hypothetical protein